MKGERRMAHGDPIMKYLSDYPEESEFWDIVPRWLGGCGADKSRIKAIVKGFFSADGSLGDNLFSIPVSPNVHSLIQLYGAFRDLGIVIMPTQKTRFATLTGLPDAQFVTPTMTNRTIATDASLAGGSGVEAANVIGTIIEASLELLQDAKAVIAPTILLAVVQGLAKRLDFAAFSGNGTDDATHGGQTGIFVDAGITAANAAATHTTTALLTRADFISVIGAVTAGALQRPCRWFINPALIATLLGLKDGVGPQYLLKTPADTGGEWNLVGFPVTWAAGAPSTDAAANKVAAFGEPTSYLVALREESEVMSSDARKFNAAIRTIRALMRGKCETREASGLATLKTAAA
jgi:HK97 family phage major capsid protein